MLSLIVSILNFAARILRLLSWILFLYGVISILLSQWKPIQKINSALSFVLEPVRMLLNLLFPSLAKSNLNLAPIALAFLVYLLSLLLSLIA